LVIELSTQGTHELDHRMSRPNFPAAWADMRCEREDAAEREQAVLRRLDADVKRSSEQTDDTNTIKLCEVFVSLRKNAHIYGMALAALADVIADLRAEEEREREASLENDLNTDRRQDERRDNVRDLS
jgi:hypothetical protein